MSKYAYILGFNAIHPYSVRPDGGLAPLGDPVPCPYGVDIACCNASKFPGGGDYLFIAIENDDDVAQDPGTLTIYRIEKDGSLTPDVPAYTNEVTNSPRCIFAFYSGTNTYDIYIDDFYSDGAYRPAGEQIRGFKFNPPGHVEPWNKKITGFPDEITGDIKALELVTTPAASPSYDAQLLLAVYESRSSEKAWIVAFSSSAFGLAYLGSHEIQTGQEYCLAADPARKFAYIVYQNFETKVPAPADIVGFKLENGGRHFVPLGKVADVQGVGLVSVDGKYLFVAYGDEGEAPDTGAMISYQIEPKGSLKKVDRKPCDSLGTPVLAIEPGGQYLYAVSPLTGTVNIYEINDADGTLTQLPSAQIDSSLGSSLTGMVVVEI